MSHHPEGSSKKVTSTLIHGIEVSSKRLGYCLNPMSLMYQFADRSPHQPKPLTLSVASATISSIGVLLIMEYIMISQTSNTNRSEGFLQAFDSLFFARLFRFYETFRLVVHVTIIFVAIYYHGSIANVIALSNNIINKKEQSHLGKVCFFVFFFKAICSSISFLFFALSIKCSLTLASFGFLLAFFVNLTSLAPIMFTCYLSAALGKHVENFSELYIDTLFDECFNSKSDEDQLMLPPDGNSMATSSIQDETNKTGSKHNCFCHYLCTMCNVIGKSFRRTWRTIKDIALLLSATRYPELPEMKMTKISSKVKITDQMRITNTHLIRMRLRKTQVMLNELRDTVGDINKMSSLIIMIKLMQESLLLVLIGTGSIQGKAYKSLNLDMIPTIAETIGLITGVVYICNCLDDTTSQLKLMINKLFDFIIMNHRFDTIDNFHGRDRDSIMGMNSLTKSMPTSAGSALSDKEDESLSETWSQFQYTRKLANTIEFTMGGILVASRRLVLPILGHVLSAVFIAIEIMSIVDTSKDAKAHSNRASHMSQTGNFHLGHLQS